VRLKENLKRVLLAVIIVIPFALLLSIDILNNSQFSPVNIYYPQVPATLAAGSITFASIVHSLLFRDEARKIYLKRTYLKNCLLRLRDWRTKRESSTILVGLYDDTERRWAEDLVKIRPITNFTLIADFLPFLFFVASILLWMLYGANSIYVVFLASLTMLYSGIAVFIWEIYGHIHSLKQVESITVASEGEGELWVQKIGQESFEKGMKTITHKVTNTKIAEVTVSFKGKITNGFFDCLLVGEKNFKQWFPDESTYFADYSYPDGLQLTVDSKFAIGVIQGKRCFENTVVTLRIPLELSLFLMPKESLNFRQEYRITERVKEIAIGVYENPVNFAQSGPERSKLIPIDNDAERHCLGIVTVKINWGAGVKPSA
jgi:hypothetical protein